MFIYENGNSLNLTFKGSIPVKNPEVIIKGYKNGASLTVNGTDVVSVEDAVEFEGKAKTFVYQKGGKLVITFNGIAGMSNPEVTVDETSDGVYDVVVNGTSVEVALTEDSVSAKVASSVAAPVVEEPTTPQDPEDIGMPEDVTGEADSEASVEDL